MSHSNNSSKPCSSPSAPPEPDTYQQPAQFIPAQIQPPPGPYHPSYAPVTPPHSSFGSGHVRPPQGYSYGTTTRNPISHPHQVNYPTSSYPYNQPQQVNYPTTSSYPYNQPQQVNYPTTSSYPYNQPQQVNYTSTSALFPPGTHPDVIRSYQMVDRNQNGFIEETELQEALSTGYQKFSRGTLRLLIFLFKNERESSNRIGPKEFADIWNCLGQWRAIFERFDRDRSGKIDTVELRDALYSLGYQLPPSVLQVLMSRYDDGTGRRGELNFDSFVECGMIVKGLTEKFKEKDVRYTGSATLTYDTFMSMIIPFIVGD